MIGIVKLRTAELTSFLLPLCPAVSWVSPVGIAIRCRLDSLGIESRWQERFFAPIRNDRVAQAYSYKMDTGSYSQVKAAGAWLWPPTPI